MQKDVTRILIEAMLDKSFRELNSDPRRSVRNLIDMGVHFSKGKFQKYFLSCAQTMLQKEDSAYYDLIADMTAHVDHKLLFTFGMNLGYNGCTRGTRVIREVEKRKGYHVPWSLSLLIDEEKLLREPEIYQKIIRDGTDMGIYVYLLFLKNGQAKSLLPLLKAWPDCAFALFLQNTEISENFLESLRKYKNTLVSVYADGQERNICERLRRQQLLYGVYYRYNENDKEALITGKWLEGIMREKPYFAFLLPESSCDKQSQEEVYQEILSVRNGQDQALLMMELRQDLLKINEVVSGDACIIGFNENGSIRTYRDSEQGEESNIFDRELEEIFQISWKTN